MRWHVLTGEYPPGCGGVGDYTALLGSALRAAGDTVEIWTARGDAPAHRLPDAFGAGSRRVLDAALRAAPGTVLLQYVPQALGARGVNVVFCRWIARLARMGVDVRIMFHEPYTYFSARPWQSVQAVLQRRMAATLLASGAQLYASTETWGRYLARVGAVSGLRVLPIPATVPADPPVPVTEDMAARVRAGAGAVVGHFGTYGAHVTGELVRLLRAAHIAPGLRLAFLGEGSERFVGDLRNRVPAAGAAAVALGRLGPAEISAALRACDVVIQPYPDGVTTRRTSVMAALANGCAVVTTDGPLTESVWRAAGPARLYPVADPSGGADLVQALLRDPASRHALGRRARETYQRAFSIERTVEQLRVADGAPRAGVA